MDKGGYLKRCPLFFFTCSLKFDTMLIENAKKMDINAKLPGLIRDALRIGVKNVWNSWIYW